MLGLDAGVHAVVLDVRVELLLAHAVEVGARDGLAAIGDDAQLLGDGHGGVDVVARNHDGADIRLGTGADRRACGLSGRIQHAGKPQKDAGTAFLFGERQHPQGFV